MNTKKQFGVVHQKFEEEFEYRDVKPADQSADNDVDSIRTNINDEAKKATDKAYLENIGAKPADNEKKI